MDRLCCSHIEIHLFISLCTYIIYAFQILLLDFWCTFSRRTTLVCMCVCMRVRYGQIFIYFFSIVNLYPHTHTYTHMDIYANVCICFIKMIFLRPHPVFHGSCLPCGLLTFTHLDFLFTFHIFDIRYSILKFLHTCRYPILTNIHTYLHTYSHLNKYFIWVWGYPCIHVCM